LDACDIKLTKYKALGNVYMEDWYILYGIKISGFYDNGNSIRIIKHINQ